MDIKSFITKLKNIKFKEEEKLEEEIKLLKDIINQKDKEILKYKNETVFTNNPQVKKIIAIIGESGSGKSLIINNLQNIICLGKQDNLCDIEFKEVNINNFSEIKKIYNVAYKVILILETELKKIKSNKNLIDKIISENNNQYKKTNIIFNKINKYSVNKKIAKNIFKNFKIIGYIKINNYCNYLLNKKNIYKKNKKYIIKKGKNKKIIKITER